MVKTPSTDSKIKRDINTFPFTIWEPFKDFLKTRSGTSYPPRSHPWRRKSFLRKNMQKVATKKYAQGNHYCQVMVRWAKVNWHRCSGWSTIESFLLIPYLQTGRCFCKGSMANWNQQLPMQWRIPWQSADTLARYPRIPRTDISGYRWLDPAIHYQGIPAQYPVSGGKIDSDNVHAINFFCLSCITSQSQRGTLLIQNGPVWRILNLESCYGSNQFFSSIGERLAILISKRGRAYWYPSKKKTWPR